MIEETDEIVNLAPILTTEQMAANKEFQKSLRARFSLPRQVQSADDYARRAVVDYLLILRVISDQFEKAKTERMKQAISEKSRQIKIDACLWMVTLGNFAEAALLCPDEATAETYRKYAAAEAAADAHWCDHPRGFLGADGKIQPNYRREFDYFSQKRGKQTTMTRCNECEMRNAVDLPPDIRELDRVRQTHIDKFTAA